MTPNSLERTAEGPRILVTGFEPFPGAPVNPTQALVKRLRDRPPTLLLAGAFRAELLPVDYQAVGPRLSEIGRSFRPDIAIHFGLAADCRGFRLERVGRNAFLDARPDNRGFSPCDGPICAGPASLLSTLPLRAIHDALSAEGLPVGWSSDAGGYLCDLVLTLSLSCSCKGFAPQMSGFVHVPLIGPDREMSEADLDRGVRIILSIAALEWSKLAGSSTQTMAAPD
ncbi:pyroglutamyl-peptidase I [Pseudaminobacter sp. 19-2017]|uniref:Pyrrolidone-carboxylate peptidase n=1 Tax=Pseudaminobacter soli (ex Zhang et al. 2022) TaxID=2831468 RepID=A0A942E6A8_9HYPH|nr:pyroglutamyl-peptidase I [Pseudaminobacter soli]MBS3649242.1 pyroglutamyl-peptidase I [Pseudaminobacter soli]